MKIVTSVCLIAVVGLLVFCQFGPSTVAAQEPEASSAKLYTAYNLWYEKPAKMASLNYHAGAIIPAGTEIAHVFSGNKTFTRKPLLSFTTAKGKMECKISFAKKWHPGMSMEEFKDRLLTTKTFEQLTEGFTKEEIDAIKKGQVVAGMSKNAVVVSLGFPPEHKTPSLEGNRWLYWTNRFRKVEVLFGDDDRAISRVSFE